MHKGEDLVIVDGARTPFCKVGTELHKASAADLASHVFRETLDQTGIDPGAIDEVILGCAGPAPGEANVARVAALRAGVPEAVPAVTVMRNCASGMESLHAALLRLRAGEGRCFLIGGAESMSNFPLLMGEQLTKFFGGLQKAKTPLQTLRGISRFRPSFLKPRIAIVEGLTDPVTGLMMGHTAENLARRFGISREEQDAFALRSHQHAAAGAEHRQIEIAPIAVAPRFDALLDADNGVREGQDMQALGKLRPVFDKRNGDVTVGNACQVTDGAAAMLVMGADRAEELGLTPLATIRGHGRAGLAPEFMGLGPVHASPLALAEAGLSLEDMDRVEINEAFAAQVLACLQAFKSEDYCREQLGLEQALGEIPDHKLNRLGGAIALGHPIAATGARITLSLAHQLKQSGERYGLATLCIGGGQGQAIVLEAA